MSAVCRSSSFIGQPQVGRTRIGGCQIEPSVLCYALQARDKIWAELTIVELNAVGLLDAAERACHDPGTAAAPSFAAL